MFSLFPYSLYFLSFSPLWVSILFIEIKSIVCTNRNHYTEWVGIGVILLLSISSMAVLLHQLSTLKRFKPPKRKIVSAREQKVITVEFLLTYILPLFAFDFTRWDEAILFCFFFIVVGYLCIHHNYYCVNVILDVMQYRFYECDLENPDGITTTMTVISRKRLNALVGEEISIKELNDDFSFHTT